VGTCLIKSSTKSGFGLIQKRDLIDKNGIGTGKVSCPQKSYTPSIFHHTIRFVYLLEPGSVNATCFNVNVFTVRILEKEGLFPYNSSTTAARILPFACHLIFPQPIIRQSCSKWASDQIFLTIQT
jgi:hypothetical protein